MIRIGSIVRKLGQYWLAYCVGLACHPESLALALMLSTIGYALLICGALLEFIPRLVRLRGALNPETLPPEVSESRPPE